MATGSGKTVVMAMLIAWQTLNKVASPRRPALRQAVPHRHARHHHPRPAPGAAARDDPGNYYDLRDLVPADLKGGLGTGADRHHELPRVPAQGREGDQGRGPRTPGRSSLAGKNERPVQGDRRQPWCPGCCAARGVGSGQRQSEIIVINDEAHHCYLDRPISLAEDEAVEQPDKEAKERNEDARVWFTGLQAVAQKVGVKAVYDLSATPFYLSGSGYKEGFIFPWTVSDFSLMDAIESGIVKVPRIPVDDDATGEVVTYLHLWDSIGEASCRSAAAQDTDITNWVPPPSWRALCTASTARYERAFRHWETRSAAAGEPPPVFIVVCPNTAVSKLVYDWIAGAEVERGRRQPPSRARQPRPLQQLRGRPAAGHGRARSWSTPLSSSPARR